MKKLTMACVLGLGVSGAASAQSFTVNEVVGISQESALFTTLAVGEVAGGLLALADGSRMPNEYLGNQQQLLEIGAGFAQNIVDRLNRAAQNDLAALSGSEGAGLTLPGME